MVSQKILNRDTAQIDQEFPVKVLQFGGGNFLRAFADWMIDILNEQAAFKGSVLLIKPTAGGSYAALEAQQGLFHVILEGLKNGQQHTEIRLIKCITQILQIYQQWSGFIKSAEIPSIRFIISNTTESGITFNPSDIANDSPPPEFPAKLTLWLYHRFKHFNGAVDKGCIFLPCELIEDNGLQLKRCLLKYAELWEFDDSFKLWIQHHNYFCNSLVDRIVSGFPKEKAPSLHKRLGFHDTQIVAGELYHHWVIEGSEEVKKELPFGKTDLRVQFVDDLAIYRNLKVRVLNGAHTAMVPVGYLAGLRTVQESIDNNPLRNFIMSMLIKEVSPTIDLPTSDIEEFIRDVVDRFKNPSLRHELLSIALNSTSKFTTRLLPTLRDFYQEKGYLPLRIVFSLAALLRLYKGEWQGQSIPLNDSGKTLSFFRNQWEQLDDSRITIGQLVKNILANRSVWGNDLTNIAGLEDAVTSYLRDIEHSGPLDAMIMLHKTFGHQ